MTRLLYLFMPRHRTGHPSSASPGTSYDIERASGDLPDVIVEQDDYSLGMDSVIDEP